MQYFAVPSNGIVSPAPNQAFYYIPSHFNLPGVYTWNVTLQRQFTPTLVVDAGWVANQGRNLPYAYNINQGPPGGGPNAEILNVLLWTYGLHYHSRLRRQQQLQLAASQRHKEIRRGDFMSRLAYTFSKSLDEPPKTAAS